MRAAIEAQETLEAIAEQASLQVNQGERTGNKLSHAFGFQISPVFQRASSARERNATVAATPKPKKCKPVIEAAPREPGTPAEIFYEIFCYDDLVLAFRHVADLRELSRETLSEIAGLPDRYASKLLSLRHVRRIGLESLGPLSGALGVKLVMVVDEAAFERNRSRYVKRDDAHYRSAKARHSRAATTTT